MLFEKSQLAIGSITNGVGIAAGSGQEVIVACIDANAIGDPLGKPGFGLSVAQDFSDFKVHDDAVAKPVAVVGWKVAENAAPNLVLVGLDRDLLTDRHGTVGLYLDIAAVIKNALALSRANARLSKQ